MARRVLVQSDIVYFSFVTSALSYTRLSRRLFDSSQRSVIVAFYLTSIATRRHSALTEKSHRC